MASNIEIKARINNPREILTRIQQLETRYEGQDRQRDTFFNVPNGRLKLRQSTLYGAFLIPYLRADNPGPRPSFYQLIPLDDPDTARDLLSQILGMDIEVRKTRSIYIYRQVRIHVDAVEGLGHFLELEGVTSKQYSQDEAQGDVEYLMRYLQIDPDYLVGKAYVDLLSEL